MRSEVVKFKTLDGATTYNSVNDWDMRLLHCDEQKPAPKFERIDVPGANGSVDVSTALSGDIPFNDREVDLTFFKNCTDHNAAFALANTVASAIHGKQLQIQTPDSYTDGNTWYIGDVEVTQVAFDDRGCQVDVHAVCDPFRYSASGSSQLLNGAAPTQLTAAPILELTNDEFDTFGLQFTFSGAAVAPWYDVPALAVETAASDNLFDLDLVNLRGKTVKSGEDWQKSNNIQQSAQTVDFGAVNLNWCERAVLTATSATSNISNVRIPFTMDSHLYVIVESSEVTAKGSVTVDGASVSAGVKVTALELIAGSIQANGLVSSSSSQVVGTLAAPAIGSEFNNVIDCGTVDHTLGQIAIDLTGVTASSFKARVMIVKDGIAVSQFVEPEITIGRVTLPQALEASSLGSDEYVSYPPEAYIERTSGDSSHIAAQSITEWARDAKYCEFAAVNSSGWMMEDPVWNADVAVWPTQTVTIDAGDMPVYPQMMVVVHYGAVVAYNGSEYILPRTDASFVTLDTLLNRNSNVIDYIIFNSNYVTLDMLAWRKGVL